MTSSENNVASQSAWLLVEAGDNQIKTSFPVYTVALGGERALYAGIAEGDWILVATFSGHVARVGRILRIRSCLAETTFYFDRVLSIDAGIALSVAGFSLPTKGPMARLQWSDFVAALQKLTGRSLEDVPLIADQSYIRELLQFAVMDDLLGPANGPHEQILDMSVRDRYLVGKLAPRDEGDAGIEGLAGPLATQDEEEPDDLNVHHGRHESGAEFGGTTGRVDAEAEATDEIDASSNQSLIPSSFGLTFCVDGEVKQIKVIARWGQYARLYDHGQSKTIKKKIKDADGRVTRTEQSEVPVKVWQRVPSGGDLTIDLVEGAISHRAPDDVYPEVRLQGTVRGKNASGDRLVTLFLVNAQGEPDENKDSAWVFQPELIVTAADGAEDKAIFRRRISLVGKDDDTERKALEMIYRKQVEFAVGHGVAVHAKTDAENSEHAAEVRTVVMPQYEVPVTETPGLRAEDRPAMRAMVDQGHLDMEVLANMDRAELVAALSILASDYGEWIREQRSRIGQDVVGHDAQANVALVRCEEIKVRLVEGLALLADPQNEKALTAFRFANRAMAKQRIHSLFALSQRRGESKTLVDFELRRYRSWRPFQLAFILLSLPSLADPIHKDRTKPLEACADLLWFPTGGGKTEAYLGVAAFAMAIRRLQGDLGGYDGSRGLTVIMRYTLRLLTLQQFQRGSALICAMELLRREAEAKGDLSWGKEPFTIGLWVGNKVTPGSTEESHTVIENIRNPEKFDAGGVSPAQLTSCPWCGCEILPKHDIEVHVATRRTTLYCGDKLGRCEFSKGKSSTKSHPGLPVLVVDEEIYHRPPSMMIGTVDKFAMMAWRGEVRTLFGRASTECPRHGLLWPDADCSGNHNAYKGLPRTTVKNITVIRPPDLIIQDEFHLISGPLGTMVGLYETAINELCCWELDGRKVQPKIVASTATVRKASEQVNNVFMRRVAVFPPHGLDVSDNFFSVQRPVTSIPGRRYLGVCSPGSSRPAMLIRVYTAFLTASQALFDRFGQAADPYLTTVGYFNSLRELGGMRRLAEDDVQTRSYRVRMSLVDRPGLSQRGVNNIRELTSRVSSRDIPKYLDQLEIRFKAIFDPALGRFVTNWEDGEARAVDVVLATNMLSVGVDVNRLGLMVVNGQPKSTAEYIQATSRVGRAFPGLVCTVLTWARPRDLSHYETFEHYHATFYRHVEAQSVTPFSPRAMDRGLTGTLLSIMRLENPVFNPNAGAAALDKPDRKEAADARDLLIARAWHISSETLSRDLASNELKERLDEWAHEANKGGRTLAYEKKGVNRATTVALLKKPGIQAWDNFTVPMSMREVEPGVRLIMSTVKSFGGSDPGWRAPQPDTNDMGGGHMSGEKTPVGEVRPSQLLWTYGPGALIDLPNLSVVTLGTESWEVGRCQPIEEARLLAAVRKELGQQVQSLRMPPFQKSDGVDPFSAEAFIGVPVRPFPRWLRCVKCGLLSEYDLGLFECKEHRFRPEQTRFIHKDCKGSNGDQPAKDADAVPARFLLACRNGHLDDFPWHYFVHNGASTCKGTLRFFESGASLQTENLWVKCDECSAARNMAHAFGKAGRENLPGCRGRHPHLDQFDAGCQEQGRAVLLGATNSWFPITLSALAIPLTQDPIAQLVQDGWDYFADLESESEVATTIKTLKKTGALSGIEKYTAAVVWQVVQSIKNGSAATSVTDADIKGPEWDVLTDSNPPADWPHFLSKRVDAPPSFTTEISSVLLLERLRQVNALLGFTRVEAPEESGDPNLRPPRASLCRNAPEWVPATQVHGEGIFIRFHEGEIARWEARAAVSTRNDKLLAGHRGWRNARKLDPNEAYPGIRYAMLHTLSHLLIRELSLECGYNAASIRERIYADTDGDQRQAGILVYTAAADSDGTLGGLVELGRPENLGRLLGQALSRAEICSSDPLCSEHNPEDDRSLHAAACHACAFVSETSCEKGNRYIDRALLVPTLEVADAAFFKRDVT